MGNRERSNAQGPAWRKAPFGSCRTGPGGGSTAQAIPFVAHYEWFAPTREKIRASGISQEELYRGHRRYCCRSSGRRPPERGECGLSSTQLWIIPRAARSWKAALDAFCSSILKIRYEWIVSLAITAEYLDVPSRPAIASKLARRNRSRARFLDLLAESTLVSRPPFPPSPRSGRRQVPRRG